MKARGRGPGSLKKPPKRMRPFTAKRRQNGEGHKWEARVAIYGIGVRKREYCEGLIVIVHAVVMGRAVHFGPNRIKPSDRR